MSRILLILFLPCFVHSLGNQSINSVEFNAFGGRIRGGQTGLRATQKPGGKIHNGIPAQQGEFPYQIALIKDRRFFCGGSIIDNNWVLTAAHCVTRMEENGGPSTAPGLEPSRLGVVYGSLYWNNPDRLLPVEQVHVHPNWVNNGHD